MSRINKLAVSTALLATCCGDAALASSHREAPFTAANPTIDGSDGRRIQLIPGLRFLAPS